MKKFDEIICGNFLESKPDDEKRLVIAGVLEGDFISANNRFYSEAIVREASKSIVGLPSLIGHDTDSPRDIVARIVDSNMIGKRLIASFKFGTDTSSNEMFTKVKEGLVNSYSIRASGSTEEGKINGKSVDIVKELKTWSIDLVVNPGVESAKVMQVFENSPEITYKNEENEMTEEQKKQLELAEANEKKLKEAEESNAKLLKEKETLEADKKKAELDAYKTQKLSTIEDKDIRADVAENLNGDSKETIDASFNKLKKLAEGVAKKSGQKIVMEPVKENEEGEFKSINDVFESKKVEKKEKVEILSSLMGK